MATPRIVVLGAGYAGLIAALRLAGKLRARAHITLINRDAHFVERIRLHEAAVGHAPRQHSLERLLRGTGIEFIQATITSLQPEQNQVSIVTAQGTQTVAYDTLFYGLGSFTDLNMLEGIREHAYTLNPQDSSRLQAALPTARNILIVGGGLTSIEAASEFAEAYPHAQVTLVTQGQLDANLSAGGQAYLRQVFAEMGIRVLENTRVTRINAHSVSLADGGEVPFGVCLWAGAFTVSPLARQAGIAVASNGQMLVDDHLRSISHPNIYGIGDAAQMAGIRMACATALPLGVYAAEDYIAQLNGKTHDRFRFGYLGRCISLGRARGLVQMVQPDDTPQDWIFTGRSGAFIKEMVCRFTVLSLYLEKRMPGSYQYSKTLPRRETREKTVWQA
jgi:NADH dehydrogenase FAD-containing subunit